MPFAGFDHIDMRVADLPSARAFYDLLLPALGLSAVRVGADTCEYAEEATPDRARRFFELTEDPAHRPNATRIAFAASSPAEVDRLAVVARDAGASAIEGPEIPMSSDVYYAVFFDDPSGNRLEIAYRRQHTAVKVIEESDDAFAADDAPDAESAVARTGAVIVGP